MPRLVEGRSGWAWQGHRVYAQGPGVLALESLISFMHFSVCVLWITILPQNDETVPTGISGQILSTNETAEPLSIQRPAVPLGLHKTQERCAKYSVWGRWPARSEPGRGWTAPRTQNVRPRHRPTAEGWGVRALLSTAMRCNEAPAQRFCWASTAKAAACMVSAARKEKRDKRRAAEAAAKERCRRPGGRGQGIEEGHPAKEQGRGEAPNGPGRAPSHLVLPSPAAQRPSGLPGAAPWLGTRGLSMGDSVPAAPHASFPATLGRFLRPPCSCAGCSHDPGRPSLCTSPTCKHRPP